MECWAEKLQIHNDQINSLALLDGELFRISLPASLGLSSTCEYDLIAAVLDMSAGPIASSFVKVTAVARLVPQLTANLLW